MKDKPEANQPTQTESDPTKKGMERLRSSLERQRKEEEKIRRAMNKPVPGFRQIFPVPKENK